MGGGDVASVDNFHYVPDVYVGIGDVWDIPVGVGGGDVTCVPIKQCHLNS